jgi:anti-sigma factor RsiW
VKPWFAGRTEFSPEVRDFADHGYALVGGRLDYINGQRVAALVYKHGAHFIDVFMWPNAGPEADPHYSTSGGYQLASWVNDGIEGRCISDIGPAEMKIFASLLYGKEG